MQTIMILDEKNYTEDMPVFERFVVRALIEKDGLFAMQQGKHGEFKIPNVIKIVKDICNPLL